ncbi:MAG TPA: hypothetical protein VES67_09865 [Vicinamibacterales bacterium]|nr:hypothetical protein [Vicinamibacterales bacterium]
MGRILNVSTLVLLVGLMGSGLTAQTDAAQPAALPTIDQVLDKYTAGSGGRAALEKVTSFRATGTIQIPDVGVGGSIELLQKAPNKASTVVELSGIGRQRDVFDGTIAWSEDPQNGVREKIGVELAEARRGATFGRELKMKSMYKTLTVKGREKVGAREAFVVEGVPDEGSPIKLFFDVESGLLVQQSGSRTSPQGPIEVTVTFEDFRAIDGVQRPFTIRQATSMFTAIIQLTDITHNVPIDDVVFRKPGF